MCDVIANELTNISYDMVTEDTNTIVDNDGNTFTLIDIG